MITLSYPCIFKALRLHTVQVPKSTIMRPAVKSNKKQLTWISRILHESKHAKFEVLYLHMITLGHKLEYHIHRGPFC